jgi:hypothetical protein
MSRRVVLSLAAWLHPDAFLDIQTQGHSLRLTLLRMPLPRVKSTLEYIMSRGHCFSTQKSS